MTNLKSLFICALIGMFSSAIFSQSSIGPTLLFCCVLIGMWTNYYMKYMKGADNDNSNIISSKDKFVQKG